jgi:hypothetical protein
LCTCNTHFKYHLINNSIGEYNYFAFPVFSMNIPDDGYLRNTLFKLRNVIKYCFIYLKYLISSIISFIDIFPVLFYCFVFVFQHQYMIFLASELLPWLSSLICLVWFQMWLVRSLRYQWENKLCSHIHLQYHSQMSKNKEDDNKTKQEKYQ